MSQLSELFKPRPAAKPLAPGIVPQGVGYSDTYGQTYTPPTGAQVTKSIFGDNGAREAALGGRYVAPAGEVAVPPQYIDPATQAPYTPEAYASMVAQKLPVKKPVGAGDVPQYAGDALTQPNASTNDLSTTATNLNNARNDIATGTTDPYKIASQSGIAFNPSELAAIEKAYAGIYDPALNDVFARLKDQKTLEDEKRKEAADALAFKRQLALKAAPTYADTQTSNESSTGDFAATVNQVANMESSVYAKKAVASQLAGLIANKDYPSAYAQIANSVENALTGVPKTAFTNARTDYGVMDGMKKAIQAYAQAGGDMGLLKGTEEEIKRKLGIDSGKASVLATQLWREFQTYRNNMTGAAFGVSESRDYASVNPTLGKSLDLNLSVIDGAMNQLKNRVTSTINQRVPSAKYIQEYAEGKTSAPSTAKILVKDGQSFDASELTTEEYNQAVADGYIAQ
jgi:hypothetical protein